MDGNAAPKSEEIGGATTMKPSEPGMYRHVITGQFSDYQIVVGGDSPQEQRTFRVHRIVLADCPYFARLFQSGFSDSHGAYRKDCSPESMECVIRHLYHHHLTVINDEGLWIEVYLLAEEFQLRELQTQLRSRLHHWHDEAVVAIFDYFVEHVPRLLTQLATPIPRCCVRLVSVSCVELADCLLQVPVQLIDWKQFDPALLVSHFNRRPIADVKQAIKLGAPLDLMYYCQRKYMLQASIYYLLKEPSHSEIKEGKLYTWLRVCLPCRHLNPSFRRLSFRLLDRCCTIRAEYSCDREMTEAFRKWPLSFPQVIKTLADPSTGYELLGQGPLRSFLYLSESVIHHSITCPDKSPKGIYRCFSLIV